MSSLITMFRVTLSDAEEYIVEVPIGDDILTTISSYLKEIGRLNEGVGIRRICVVPSCPGCRDLRPEQEAHQEYPHGCLSELPPR